MNIIFRKTPQRSRLYILNSFDRLIMALVDLMLVWGVSASFSYWLVLLFRWPIWAWFLVLVLIIMLIIIRFWACFEWSPFVENKEWFIVLLLACLASASINIFTNRPDSDDISFSHRAFVAAIDMSVPVAMTDTQLDVANLPYLTPAHLFTSVEVTTSYDHFWCMK